MNKEQLQALASKLSPIELRAELFKKGNYDFIVKGKNEEGKLVEHKKQRKALEILTSNKYDEFLYGGAAGGAKSWTGCAWIMFMCICYPGVKAFIARNELKDIVDSVLVTFNKVAKAYGFSEYKYNAVKNFIQFNNGSHINFIEVKYKPSDPMFEDVGSTEYTIGWIEEVGETHPTGALVLSSRVGRHLNAKYGIKGIVFYTGNPKNNWTKRDFYDKSVNNILEKNKYYLPCLITENPFIEKDYIRKLENIAKFDNSLYQRLFLGNWDYEDNPNALCDHDSLDAIYHNDHVKHGQGFITADAARFGSDKAVIGVWKGWVLVEMVTFAVSKTTEIQTAISLLRRKYGIPKNRCLVDSDGVGGGIQDSLGIKGFVNNSRPIKVKGDMPNYKNLQVQCLYYLADIINEAKIWISCELSGNEKQEIRQELFQIQSKVSDVGKLDCKSKSDIKDAIGRSPDYRDMIMMRSFFDLKPTRRRTLLSVPK